MKKTISRILSKRITDFATKSVGSRKTIVGALPVPKELRKSE